jgi:hypothetical protein
MILINLPFGTKLLNLIANTEVKVEGMKVSIEYNLNKEKILKA